MKLIAIVLGTLLAANFAHAKSVRCTERDANFSSVSVFNSTQPFFEQTMTMDGEAIVNTLMDNRVVCMERRDDLDDCTATEKTTGRIYEFTYECGERALFTLTLNGDGTGLATCTSAFTPNDQRELVGCR